MQTALALCSDVEQTEADSDAAGLRYPPHCVNSKSNADNTFCSASTIQDCRYSNGRDLEDMGIQAPGCIEPTFECLA